MYLTMRAMVIKYSKIYELAWKTIKIIVAKRMERLINRCKTNGTIV